MSASDDKVPYDRLLCAYEVWIFKELIRKRAEHSRRGHDWTDRVPRIAEALAKLLRRDRPYRSGRSLDWIKVKNPDAPAATRVIEGQSSANAVLKDFINDPTYWCNRADETRELAKRVSDDAARKRLSALAIEYARIALNVEDRINRMKGSR